MTSRLRMLCLMAALAASASASFVAVSHPFSDSGDKIDLYEMLSVSSNGTFGRPGITFRAAPSLEGEIIFVPDADAAKGRGLRYGVVATDNGTLAVFAVDDQTGSVKVIQYSYKMKSGCYATTLVVHPLRRHVFYVLDVDVLGGICTVSIEKGVVVELGSRYSWKSPASLSFLHGPSERVVIVSWGGAVALVAWSDLAANRSILATGGAFSDTDAIVSGACVTSDQRYVVVLDDNEFSANGNRIGVAELVEVDSNKPTIKSAVQVFVKDLSDPASIVCTQAASNLDTIVIVEAEGNAILTSTYRYSPSSSSPLTTPQAIKYKGPKPQLPVLAIAVPGTKQILVSELSGPRTVEVQADGTVVDLGVFDLGPNTPDAVGSMGMDMVR